MSAQPNHVLGRYAALSSREIIRWIYRQGGHITPSEDLQWLVVCQDRVFKRETLIGALQAWADEQRSL